MRAPRILTLLLLLAASCGPDKNGVGQLPPLEHARRATVALEIRGRDEHGAWVSHATGSIVDAAGYVVTCEHVTATGTRQEVFLHDGRRAPYRVVARAGGSFDLALLAFEPPGPLTVMPLGDGDGPGVGELVTILGNPGGAGIRALEARVRRVDAGAGTQLETVEAAVVPGDSGGPVLDAQGRMVAHVHVAIRGHPGVARHVTVAHVRRAFRGWLWNGADRPGVRIACDGGPARVLAVRPNAPAARAGIAVGDVVSHVDGVVVPDGIAAVLRSLDHPAGRPWTWRLRRAGEVRTVRFSSE